MDVLTQNNLINKNITFIDSSSNPLEINIISLSCNTEQQKITKISVILEVSLEIYQQIKNKHLFNLKPDISNTSDKIKFIPQSDILIEATLNPDLLHLSEQQLDDVLLSTESWLALSVKQQQETREVGYKTFWSYINPSLLSEENNTTEEELTQGISNFFEDLISNSLDAATKEITEETLGDISNLWSKLTEDITEESVSLFETVVNFFTQDDWSFMRIQGDSALKLLYEGKSGQ